MDGPRLETLLALAQRESADLDALFQIAAEVKEIAPSSGVAPADVLATRGRILRMVGERAMAAGVPMPLGRAPSEREERSPCCVLDRTVLEVFALDAFLRLRLAPEDPAARQSALPVVIEMRRREADGDLQEALDNDLARLRSAAPWPRLEVITFGTHRVEAFPICGQALVTVDGVYRRVLEGSAAEPPMASGTLRWHRLEPFFGKMAPTADSALSVTERTDGNHFRQYTTRSTVLSLTAEGVPRIAVSVAETDESYY